MKTLKKRWVGEHFFLRNRILFVSFLNTVLNTAIKSCRSTVFGIVYVDTTHVCGMKVLITK